jgi:hypothetical protein
MKLIILLFCISFSLDSFAQTYVKCYESVDKKTKLSLTLVGNSLKNLIIQYKNQDESILLRLKGSKQINKDIQVEGRPGHFVYFFDEIIDSKIYGEYRIDVQGAVFGDLIYQSKTKKEIIFKENLNLLQQDNCNCEWN